MAVVEQDFEKGEADGTVDALRVLETIAGALGEDLKGASGEAYCAVTRDAAD